VPSTAVQLDLLKIPVNDPKGIDFQVMLQREASRNGSENAQNIQ
jgi:hypothetical protein